MSHLLHMIFIFLLNCVLLFLHQHVGLSTSDDNMRDDDSDFGLDQHAIQHLVWEILLKIF
jgi:hypothetical protein